MVPPVLVVLRSSGSDVTGPGQKKTVLADESSKARLSPGGHEISAYYSTPYSTSCLLRSADRLVVHYFRLSTSCQIIQKDGSNA